MADMKGPSLRLISPMLMAAGSAPVPDCYVDAALSVDSPRCTFELVTGEKDSQTNVQRANTIVQLLSWQDLVQAMSDRPNHNL